MILENEIQKLAVRKQTNWYLHRSLFAFSLFIVSLALNLPHYAYPIKYHYVMLGLTLFSVLTLTAAITLSIMNLIMFKAKVIKKNAKSYTALFLNVIVVSVTVYNFILMFQYF